MEEIPDHEPSTSSDETTKPEEPLLNGVLDQFQTENPNRPSAENVKRVKTHPLFPTVEKLITKIELAMECGEDRSVFDMKEIIKEISSIKTSTRKEDPELDRFMRDAVATHALQLREIEQVVEYTDKFIVIYRQTLRKRVPVEALVAMGESEDDMPLSPSSSTDEANGVFLPLVNPNDPASVGVVQTSTGTISIPLVLPPSEPQKHAAAKRALEAADSEEKLRMFILQSALRPNMTAAEKRKFASDIGCDEQQLDNWLSEFKRHAEIMGGGAGKSGSKPTPQPPAKRRK